MSTMIQIRNVPDALHRQLKSRAALAGMSLSDYLLAEGRQISGAANARRDARTLAEPPRRRTRRSRPPTLFVRSAIARDCRRRISAHRSVAAHAFGGCGGRAPVRLVGGRFMLPHLHRCRSCAGDPALRRRPARSTAERGRAAFSPIPGRPAALTSIRMISCCRASGICGTISRPMMRPMWRLPRRSMLRSLPATGASAAAAGHRARVELV